MPGPSAGPACAAAPATVAAADPGPDVQPAIVGTAPLRSHAGHWPDEAACAAQAAALAARPEVWLSCIELEGPLGAGKTTFARHLLRALGVTGRVRSPTYTLAESYEVGGRTAWHFDFYRFDDPREWIDAGLRDAFVAPGLKLVEWPERARAVLPVPDLRVAIEPGDGDERRVRLEACTPRGEALLGGELERP